MQTVLGVAGVVGLLTPPETTEAPEYPDKGTTAGQTLMVIHWLPVEAALEVPAAMFFTTSTTLPSMGLAGLVCTP
jgi:hypothetical protein